MVPTGAILITGSFVGAFGMSFAIEMRETEHIDKGILSQVEKRPHLIPSQVPIWNWISSHKRTLAFVTSKKNPKA